MDSELTIAAVYPSAAADGRMIGCAILRPRPRTHMKDTTAHSLVLYQFLDGERYTNLEALLVQAAPSHVYMADVIAANEFAKLVSAVEACDLTHECVSKSATADADVPAQLRKLTGDKVPYGLEERRLAMRAAAMVLHKGSLATGAASGDSTSEDGACLEVVAGDLGSYVRLDAAAVRALNMFPSAREMVPAGVGTDVTPGTAGAAAAPGGGGAGITSLHALVSYGCKTKGGKRLLRQWLLQPLLDADAILGRQRLVELFVQSAPLRKAWREGTNLPDLEALAARLNRKTATLQDLLRLYHFALLLPQLVQRLNGDAVPEDVRAHLRATFVERLELSATEFKKYMELVEKVVDDVGSPEPRISPSWDPELGALMEERDELEGQIHAVWTSATRPGGWGADLADLKCERDKVRGYVFRVRRTSEKAVRAIPGVHIAAVLKDGLYFTTVGSHGLKRLGDRLLEVEAEYDVKSRAVFTSALEVARSYTPLLESTATVIAELDAVCSLAHLATTAPGQYVKPSFTPTGSGDIIIRSGRHPIMEFLEGAQFIPNDYELVRDGGRFVIITGPNMGGKSTYIRSLGCICLLAQMGSYVPAESATISAVDMICARVGAGDRALRGVSTFMAEMMEASSILSAATDRSLVIIDELGRGTSTYDGFGLAWAISEHLACTTKCFTLFATHFHELTDLASSVASVRNKHVTAHTSAGSITMLYNVKDGVCPTSFGIHVAELAGFPRTVIDEARRKAAQLEATAGQAGQLLHAQSESTAAFATPLKATTQMDDGLADTDAADAFVEAVRARAAELFKLASHERIEVIRSLMGAAAK